MNNEYWWLIQYFTSLVDCSEFYKHSTEWTDCQHSRHKAEHCCLLEYQCRPSLLRTGQERIQPTRSWIFLKLPCCQISGEFRFMKWIFSWDFTLEIFSKDSGAVKIRRTDLAFLFSLSGVITDTNLFSFIKALSEVIREDFRKLSEFIFDETIWISLMLNCSDICRMKS